MRDYTAYISPESASKIVSFFASEGYEVQEFEGVLQDNYLITIGENNCKSGNIKFRKYLIIHEKAVNEWSSILEMILTDNEKLYRAYEGGIIGMKWHKDIIYELCVYFHNCGDCDRGCTLENDVMIHKIGAENIEKNSFVIRGDYDERTCIELAFMAEEHGYTVTYGEDGMDYIRFEKAKRTEDGKS